MELESGPSMNSSFPLAVWPKYPGSREYCFCPICLSATCNIKICGCGGNSYNIDVEFSDKSESAIIRWSNLTYDMTNTRVYVLYEFNNCAVKSELFLKFTRAAEIVVGRK